MEIFERIARTKQKIRIDKYLVQCGLNLSRTKIQSLIDTGNVLVNGKLAKSNKMIKYGDKIVVKYEKIVKKPLEGEPIPLDILYEDDYLIVVNKPAGIVTHPAPGHLHGTLVNALLYHCELAKSNERPGVVHRLDKNTSGVLVFAKKYEALSKLALQVSKHIFTRKYVAIVWGKIFFDGEILAPIGRDTIESKRMSVTPLKAKEAKTYFSVLNNFNYATMIEAKLQTGRTHQIRVHFSHIGHPVIGDEVYGGRTYRYDLPIDVFKKSMEIMKRQALHAKVLGFIHPITNKYMEFSSPIPSDMQQLIEYHSSL